MKPLYERYRLVKKTLSTEMVQWEAFKTTGKTQLYINVVVNNMFRLLAYAKALHDFRNQRASCLILLTKGSSPR